MSQTATFKWPCLFFSTAHNFANGPHFVALTQLRATKTGSKICCTHLSYTYSESWVRKDSVGTCPEKFSRPKFSGTERFTKKFHFSLISLAASKKKYRARVLTILMPQTFPIARLNPYTLWAKLRLRVAGSRLPYTSKDLRHIQTKAIDMIWLYQFRHWESLRLCKSHSLM